MNIRKFLIKGLLTTLLLVGSVCGLSGCHGSKGLDAFVMPEQLDENRKIEITFWNKNDSNKVQVAAYKRAISEFEKLYPNITVNMKQYTDYSRIYNDVITNISTNTTPNVCITYPDHIATYRTGINVVLPLDELMVDERFGLGGSEVKFDSPTKDEIVPKFLDECKFDDGYYALPFMRSSECLYINKDLVEKLGYEIPDILDWDFVWEVSEKAMEKNSDGTFKINDQNVLIPFIYKSTDNMMITMLKQAGAGYSTSEGDIEIFNDTTSSILKEIAKHAKSGSFSTFAISSYPGNFLNAGQCIFAIDSTAGATWMGTASPHSDIAEESKIDMDLVVRPIPQFDDNNIKMISQGPSLCIFNKEDPQEVLASWLFAQYLLTNDIQLGYSSSEGYVPVTLKAQESKEYQEYLSLAGTDDDLHYQTKIDATKIVLENTDNTFVTPVFNGSASLRTAAGALIEDVTKSERRGKSVDDSFISDEYSKVSSLYHLNQSVGSAMEKKDLGPLPSTAKNLLLIIALAWVCIIAYVIYTGLKKKD